MTYYGIKKSKPETPESVFRYAERKGLFTDDIVFPRDSLQYAKGFESNKAGMHVIVYNKTGSQVFFTDTSVCNAQNYDYTEHICENNIRGIDSSSHLKEELSSYVRIDKAGNVTDLKMDPSADYTVFLYWVRAAGRLNKNHTEVWDRNLRNSKDCKVVVYKVNWDFPAKYYSQKDIDQGKFNK